MQVNFYKKTTLVVVFAFSWFSLLTGQNLVPNYSFEIYSTCPLGFGGPGATVAPPWVAPTFGTPDIFNECSTTDITDVPDNFFGVQPAVTGVGYAGGYCKLPGMEYREYVQAPLTTPLVAGTWYYVSFYTAPAEYGCAIEKVGAYLSVTAPTSGSNGTLNVSPQIEYVDGYIDDYENWTLVSGCFLASGGEAYITIGNFHDDAGTPTDCGTDLSYYYFEDVTVTAGDPPSTIDFDMGGPIFECFSYEIDPEVPGYNYIWEDGSHDPTLVVTESGIYNLTITDGCNYGVDSIEVTIGGNFPPVDLGPDEISICNGDSYDISFDPNFEEYTWQDGSNEPEYSITTAGTYSVTLDDGCGVSSDEIEVTVLEPPQPIDLGEDAILCFGDEIDMVFDPSLGDFLWQDGTTFSSYLISTGGLYSVTVSNICGEVTDELLITDLEVPEVELGQDEQNLCEGEILEFDIDPDLGDIVWQDGSTNPVYEISTPGLYTLYISNECGTGSDDILVTYTDAPDVNLGPDIVECGSEAVILTTAATVGTYLWQDNSVNDTLIVTTPGTYSLTVSNFCGDASDVVNVDYTALPTPVNFGPDVSLCPGEQLTLDADNPGATFQWQDNSSGSTYVVSSAGTYYVLVSNSCGSATDTINVAVNDNPPQVDLPAQLNLCQGQIITLDANVGGVTYLWNDNSQNQQLVVATPGTYSLTVSNACGTDRDTVNIIDGGPAPLVALGNDIDICPGEQVILTPTFSNVDTWLWQDGSALPTFTIAAAGQINVAVSNACGSSFDTLLVGQLPATPPLDLGADTSLCSGESFTLTILTPGVSIVWPDGSTTPDFIVSGPGTVPASISDVCGTSYDTIIVTALPDIPALDLGPDQSLCPGEIITLDPGILNVDYLWQDGSVANTFQSTQEETIILIISNDCGMTTDTLEVIESTQGPQVNLGPDLQECEGATINIPSGISGVNYLWQDGSGNPDFIATQSGTVILQVSNNCGTDADTLIVDISGVPPTPALGPDTTLCEGITLTLTSLADAISTPQWQNGSSASTFIVSSPGIYWLFETNRCGEATDSVVVDYLDAPDPFSLGNDTILCPGESINLLAPPTSFNLTWQDGSVQSSITADQPGTYSLQISNECGIESDELILTYDTRIPQVDLGPDQELCEGDILTLNAAQVFAADYVWSNGSITSSIDISAPGIYSVDVSTLCNLVSEEIEILPGTDCYVPKHYKEMYIPNVFSPNDDGINDLFTISFGQDLEVTKMQGSIFDRWGNLVFSTEAIPFSWNGKMNEEDVLPGVYVLVLSWEFNENGRVKTDFAHRDVTVLR
jgi:gliding motility-associated-like protein